MKTYKTYSAIVISNDHFNILSILRNQKHVLLEVPKNKMAKYFKTKEAQSCEIVDKVRD